MEDNIRLLLLWLEKNPQPIQWKIILLVNGSSDQSEEIAQKLASKYPEEIKAVISQTAGKGGAIKEYFLVSEADILCYMDIDLAVSLSDIPALINPIIERKYDLTIGSRLLAESTISRPFIRELSSQTYNILSRFLLGHHFSDLQCGFKAIKKESYQKIAPFIQDRQWFFDTELVILSQKANIRIVEVPVDWSENRYEKRKSRIKLLRDSWDFFKKLFFFKWRLKNIVEKINESSNTKMTE
jgi:glycosyltransferase involved in cell wall biosynthesis